MDVYRYDKVKSGSELGQWPLEAICPSPLPRLAATSHTYTKLTIWGEPDSFIRLSIASTVQYTLSQGIFSVSVIFNGALQKPRYTAFDSFKLDLCPSSTKITNEQSVKILIEQV